LAQVGCTHEEIAGALNVSEELLHRRFARQLRQGAMLFRGRVRALLLESAAEGKVAAQVALCRLHLRDDEKEGREGDVSQERPLEEMTMSEMLEAYMKQRKRERKG